MNNENTTVNELIKGIKENLKQSSTSAKDEMKIMRAMLNDDSFSVTYYLNSGDTEQHCPAQEFRGMISNIVSDVANIPKSEAEKLTESYECKKSDAETMITLSKDFINTTLRSGRKIKLGGTEQSDISIKLKEHPATVKSYPIKTVNDDGSVSYVKKEKQIPAHEGLIASSPCPKWVTD